MSFNKKGEEKVFLGLVTIILSLAADLVSKFFIDTKFVVDEYVAVNDYFNLVKVWNTGVSFSMFNSYGDLGSYILIGMALAVCCGLLCWMYHETDRIRIVCLGLIIGGALGNVLDRMRYGAVMDFLDFHFATYHWPAFNLADTFICVGAAVLILLEIRDNRRKKKGWIR